jgi:4-amino-4-deoxy-L-arabinose transferase-like glycosyltransferase
MTLVSRFWRHHRNALALTAIALLAVVLRAPFFRWPLTGDEGAYAYIADWWGRGETLYGDRLWLDRPQAIFVAYRLGMALLGGSTAALRLWGALWAAATAPLIHGIARRLFTERAALWAALLYAVYAVSPQIEGFTANAELFMLLPATASLLCLLERRWWLAGLLAGVGVMLKPSGLSAGLLALVWLARERAPWPTYARYAAGAAVAPLLSLAHGAATVGVGAYLFALVASRGQIERAWMLVVLLTQLALTLPAWLPLTAAGLLGQRDLPRPGRRLLALWALTALAGMALGGGWYRHYFSQLMPPLAVWAAAALDGLAASGRRQRLGLALAALASIALTMGPYLVISPQTGADRIFEKPLVTHADAVAAYLRARTTANDTIYVAYEGPQLCYLAERRCASRYLFNLHVAHLPGVYDEIVALVAAGEPKYVVTPLFRPALSDPDERLTLALAEHYDLVESIDLVQIYRRRGPERASGR